MTGKSVHLSKPGNDRKVEADVARSRGMFTFEAKEWLEQPEQVSREHDPESGTVTMTHWGRHEIVADYKPRVLWGEHEGEPFTVLDARMRIKSGPYVLPIQTYEAYSLLRGAHVHEYEAPAEAVRVAFNINHAGWTHGEPIDIPNGRISPWATSEAAGLIWEPKETETELQSIHYLSQRFIPLVQVLLELWTGEKIGIQAVDIYLPEMGWCSLESGRDHSTKPPRHPLLNMSDLAMETLAQWLQLVPQLGALPFLAVADRVQLQPQAQVMTTALEGLHERLHPETYRFTASKSQRRKAIRSAAKEAAKVLTESGVDEKIAEQAYREALTQAHRPTFIARLEELVPGVEVTAPGLMGPSTLEWIRDIRDLRNTLNHGADKDDNFGEPEISRYYVLSESAKWVLRIRLLLELVHEKGLMTALWRYDRFMFALANIDRERYWPNFSAYDHFLEVVRKTSHAE